MKLDDPRITTYLPVVLLIFFALLQIDRSYRHGQSPWNGGGFGMFSTNDRVSLRHVRVYAIRAGKADLMKLGPRLRPRVRNVTSYPSQENLISLGRQLSMYETVQDASALRVEVWRTRFDSDTATAHLERVSQATYRKPG